MDIIEYARSFIGKPYIWGGSGALGFDCSGFAIECLQAFGYIPSGDWTSKSLYTALLRAGWTRVEPSQKKAPAVCFWGKDAANISHVSLYIGDGLVIEAGGGDSGCTSAENSKGMVRIRPYTWRKDLVAIVRKF